MRQTLIDEILEYEKIIIGTPTWYDGEHQSDWEEVIGDLEEADLSGKTVALFGLSRPIRLRRLFFRCDGNDC
ncbi:MAG: hypothetical protein DWQ06_02185 [Calditrichaeota bacterium]|nr:MAG: hypothetical protein DWQ06_02185 [Calditrichota bacterium]